MITIYGLKTCPDCDAVEAQIAGKEDQYKFIDIGKHVMNMHEFIDLRDSRDEFASVRGSGKIGIPAFVLENGRITFDPVEAGLNPAPADAPACSIEDHKEGKKGC